MYLFLFCSFFFFFFFFFSFLFYPRFYVIIVICIRPSAWTKHGLRRQYLYALFTHAKIIPRERRREKKEKKKKGHKHSGVEISSNPIPTKITWKSERARVNSWEVQIIFWPWLQTNKQNKTVDAHTQNNNNNKLFIRCYWFFFFNPTKPFAMVLLQ